MFTFQHLLFRAKTRRILKNKLYLRKRVALGDRKARSSFERAYQARGTDSELQRPEEKRDAERDNRSDRKSFSSRAVSPFLSVRPRKDGGLLTPKTVVGGIEGGFLLFAVNDREKNRIHDKKLEILISLTSNIGSK